MEKQISPEELYEAVRMMRLKIAHIEKRIGKEDNNSELFLVDRELLAEDWLSAEDEEAWKDL